MKVLEIYRDMTVNTAQPVILRRQSELSPWSALSHGGQFRILKLLPGQVDDPIACTIETAIFPSTSKSPDSEKSIEMPEYETVSYTWGNSMAETEILVNGIPVEVTPNLHDGLRRFRFPDRPRKLWIDQLCINQWDMEEKASQVEMMREIYKNCTKCLIWLGEIDPALQTEPRDVEELFKYWRILVDPESHMPIQKPLIWSSSEEGDGIRKALAEIMKNPWWGRVWTVQEAVLPPRADMIWGQHSIELETMSLAAACLCDGSTGIEDEIWQLFPTGEYISLSNEFTMPVRGLDFTKKGESSLKTLHRWRYRRATDSRDKVYALVGLMVGLESDVYLSSDSDSDGKHSNDSSEWKNMEIERSTEATKKNDSNMIKQEANYSELKPGEAKADDNKVLEDETEKADVEDDKENHTPYAWQECSYTIDPAKLYANVTVDLIRESQDLQALTAGRDIHVTHGLPTWAYDLEYERRPIPCGGWEQIMAYWEYRATGNEKPIMQYFPDEGMISLKGFMIDKVTVIDQGLGENTWDNLSNELLFSTFKRWKQTLNTWREQHVSGDEYLGGGSIDHAFEATVIGEVLTDDEFPRWKADDEDYQRLREYLNNSNFSFEYINRAVYFSAIGKAFFITEKGYIGFGHEIINIGDEIWVFYGSNMPMILRPHGERFKLIKEAYVHGIMHGESLQQVSDGDIRLAEII